MDVTDQPGTPPLSLGDLLGDAALWKIQWLRQRRVAFVALAIVPTLVFTGIMCLDHVLRYPEDSSILLWQVLILLIASAEAVLLCSRHAAFRWVAYFVGFLWAGLLSVMSLFAVFAFATALLDFRLEMKNLLYFVSCVAIGPATLTGFVATAICSGRIRRFDPTTTPFQISLREMLLAVAWCAVVLGVLSNLL